MSRSAYIVAFLAIIATCFLFPAADAKKVNGALCNECTEIISAIEYWVENNSTEAEIQQYLDSLCTNVPAFTPICDAVVNYGLSYVIRYLELNGSPSKLCSYFGVCTTEMTNIKASGMTCFVCEEVVSTVESWVESNYGVQEIETLLSQVCPLIPSWEAQCNAIVQAGVPTLISWLQANENATQVCTQLTLCGSTKMMEMKKPVQKVQDNALYCEGCHIVISAAERWIANNETEATIEKYLQEFFCSVGGKFTQTCEAIIQEGVPEIINWVELYENAETVCEQLGVCSAKLIKKPVVFNPKKFVKIN